MSASVEVDINEVYQLLISTCRYGYTRFNHLEPSCSFMTCKEILPKMLEADLVATYCTAKQLCEECIDVLSDKFYDCHEDEFGNRTSMIEFINWLLDYLEYLKTMMKIFQKK